MDRDERSKPMAAVIVEAVRQGEDAGELIAAALQEAANELGSADELVIGRPGSWEANILLNMAAAGGEAAPDFAEALAALFVEMGEDAEDGGEVLSLACSEAVDQLQGFGPFAGGSTWWWDLCNLGKQFSQSWPDDPYEIKH